MDTYKSVFPNYGVNLDAQGEYNDEMKKQKTYTNIQQFLMDKGHAGDRKQRTVNISPIKLKRQFTTDKAHELNKPWQVMQQEGKEGLFNPKEKYGRVMFRKLDRVSKQNEEIYYQSDKLLRPKVNKPNIKV